MPSCAFSVARARAGVLGLARRGVSVLHERTTLRSYGMGTSSLAGRWMPAGAQGAMVGRRATLLVPCRAQSSLHKLLSDPSDPYLAALEDFDIPRIAAILAAGPDSSDVPPEFLRRMGVRVDRDGIAAARARQADPTPLTQREAQSSGEAVLQSLHAVGAERQHAAEAAAAADVSAAHEAYNALPPEERAALQRERVVSHFSDGLCAMNAALRIQAEHDSVSSDERDAAYSVYEQIIAAHRRGMIEATRWNTDFLPEMKELSTVWHHVGDARLMPLE